MKLLISRWCVTLTLVMLLGCGGGGTDNRSSATLDDPVSRDLLFTDEAIERVRDRTQVSCTDVICSGDGDAFGAVDSMFGTISIGCQYVCLPVAIDGTEERHYWVFLAWRRLEATCFDSTDFDTLIVLEITAPCEPTI